MSAGEAAPDPIDVEIVVPADPERAFALYVDRPGRRHPGAGFSGAPSRVVYEPRAGGRWYEVGPDGAEHEWGRVVVWEPPHRLELAWMVGAADGSWAFDPDPAHASRLRSFYGALGLPEVFRAPGTGPVEHVEVDVVGTRLGLTSVSAANRHADLGVGASTTVDVETVLWCDDVPALHEMALAAGGTEVVAPAAAPGGALLRSWLRDPEGHLLDLVQHA